MHAKFITVILLFVAPSLFGQTLFYIRLDLTGGQAQYFFETLDLSNCTTSTQFQLQFNNSFSNITDVAVCPDGNFYVTNTEPNGYYISSLNMSNGTVTPLVQNPTFSNSLVCDAAGVLYSAGSDNLYTYDTNTGVSENLGFFGFSLAGDLTFINGELYGTTFGNELVHLYPDDLISSFIVYAYPIPGNLLTFGVTTDASSCNSSQTYISATGGAVNQIYVIDPVTQTADLVCNTPGIIVGATSPGEFLASDCNVLIDLDDNNSSGALGSDFAAPVLCATDVAAIADVDATYYSGNKTDSIRVRLLPAIPDGAAEFLTAQSSGAVTVTGQNTTTLLLKPGVTSTVLTANQQLEAVLKTLQWHDVAPNITPGLRTIEVIAFAKGNYRDTAYAKLQVALPAQTNLSATICAGSTYNFNGNLLTNAGVYADTLAAINGCDSISTLTLSTFYNNLSLDTTLCAGQTLLWNGQTLTSSGVYSDTILTNGCLTAAALTVNVLPALQTSATASICAGSSYNFNGKLLTAAGVYADTLAAINGCDSISTLTLSTFYNSLSLDTTLCAGQTLLWNGQTLASSGVYSDTILANGCLTAAALSVTVLPALQTSATASICAGSAYNFNGKMLTAAGIYADTLAAINGCDSISTLTLSTFYNSLSLDTTLCAGQTLFWNGQTLASSGVYSDTILANGCLTAAALTVNVLPAPQTSATASICAGSSYNFNGKLLTTAGIYADTLAAINGCDSISTLTLSTFYNSLSLDTTLCAGQTLFWNGQTLASSGVYSDTILANGCLTAAALSITVLPAQQTSATASICAGSSYNFNGKMLTAAGIYADTLAAISGCDSITTLTLSTFYNNLSLDTTLCAGQTLLWNGQTLAASGVYSDTILTNGCLTAAALSVTVLPAQQTAATATICAGSSYEFNGAVLTTSGVYTDTLTAISGCDSLVVLTLEAATPPQASWLAVGPNCYGGTDGYLELQNLTNGTPPYTYQLNGGAWTSEPLFEQLPALSGQVLVRDSLGCVFAQDFVLEQPLPWTLLAGPDGMEILPGESLQLFAEPSIPGVFSFVWTPAQGLACVDCANPLAQPTDSVYYLVTATDTAGCSVQSGLTIRINRDEPAYYAPNVFSPNGDGENDFFTLFAHPAFFEKMISLQVYDRWGELVFERKDLPFGELNQGWDGVFRGSILHNGVYVWYAELLLKDGTIWQKAGEVLLAR